MQQLKLVATSVALAGMIWLVADHSLTDTDVVQVQLMLTPAQGSDALVSLASPSNQFVDITVTGKRAAIGKLSAREPVAVRIRVPDRPSTPRFELDLVNALRQARGDLSDVYVQDVTPSTIDVRIDRRKQVVMPVRVESSGSLDYEIPPRADPDEVMVTISELAYENIDPVDRAVLLDPDEYLVTLPPGGLESVNVPLTSVVAGTEVQLDPEYVTIHFKLKGRLKQVQIPAIPIKIESSLDMFNSYQVEIRDAGPVLTQSITIKGPPEVVDAIVDGTTRVYGVIVLTAAHKLQEGNFQYMVPQFRLPDRVELVGEPESVEIRLIPRPTENVP